MPTPLVVPFCMSCTWPTHRSPTVMEFLGNGAFFRKAFTYKSRHEPQSRKTYGSYFCPVCGYVDNDRPPVYDESRLQYEPPICFKVIRQGTQFKTLHEPRMMRKVKSRARQFGNVFEVYRCGECRVSARVLIRNRTTPFLLAWGTRSDSPKTEHPKIWNPLRRRTCHPDNMREQLLMVRGAPYLATNCEVCNVLYYREPDPVIDRT